MSSLWDILLTVAIAGRVGLLVVAVSLLSLLLALVLLPLLLLLSTELATLFVQVEFVNQALDVVIVLSLALHLSGGWVGAGLLLLLEGNILDGVSINVLFWAESVHETLFLVDFNDGEILTAATASKEAGVDNVLNLKIKIIRLGIFGDAKFLNYLHWNTYVPEGSAAVITRSAVEEFGGHHGGKNWAVLASSQVDSLLDVVDLVLIIAKFFECLGPWLLLKLLK